MLFSYVFDSDFLEVLTPVLLETHIFLPFGVEFGHDVVQTLLEASFELQVVFVARTDHSLVVKCVLDYNLCGNFILLALWNDSGAL